MQLIYQSMGRFGSTIGYKILQHFHYSDLWPSSSPEPGRSRGPAAPRGAQAAPVYRPPPNANGQTPEAGSHELPWGKAIPPLSARSPLARPTAPAPRFQSTPPAWRGPVRRQDCPTAASSHLPPRVAGEDTRPSGGARPGHRAGRAGGNRARDAAGGTTAPGGPRAAAPHTALPKMAAARRAPLARP